MKTRGLKTRTLTGRQQARMEQINQRNAAASKTRYGVAPRSMAMTALLMVTGFLGRLFGFGGGEKRETTATVAARPCPVCGMKTSHPGGACSSKHHAEWMSALGAGKGYGRIVRPLYL